MQEILRIHEVERHLLLNVPLLDNVDSIWSEPEDILNGKYAEVLNNDFCKYVVARSVDENIEANIKKSIDDNEGSLEQWFFTGVTSLLYFIQNNWTVLNELEDINWLLTLRKSSFTYLSLKDQCNDNVVKPELLHLAEIILSNCVSHETFRTSLWWLLRVYRIHQLILEESSEHLFKISESLIDSIEQSYILENDAALQTIFSVEVAQFYMYYQRVQSSEKYLQSALKHSQLDLKLEGALGKRTKYQQQEKAQLYLKVKVDKELFPYRICEALPKVVELEDDLILEKIEFTEEIEKDELGSFEEAVVLTKFYHLQLSQPKDELKIEEVTPYLNCIIDNSKNWALKVSALIERCILESTHKRTIERALNQLEFIKNLLNSTQLSISYRMDLFFASNMKPVWFVRGTLAQIMLNIGMVKDALDHFLILSSWEFAIVCCTVLGMRHKAAEIIQQELAKKPTVKLWCLLGDATQNVEHYETAWKLSGEKSSRAQRHWGFHYYSRKDYSEAIPHLKLSVQLNNIQENVWIKLGFAALQTENWQLAVSAYKSYCSLEQTSFEAWNNLAKAYIKLGEKVKARLALQNAIKCNYEKWEVWANYMVVATDLAHFSEAIHCYHRIIEIKGAHVDIQVLCVLSKAIINNLKDPNGNPARKYLKETLELFGRLTAKVINDPDVWRLYAELTLLKNNDLDNQKAVQYFQRAYRAAVANPRWFQTVEDANIVLDTCIRLAVTTMNCLENCAVRHKRAVLGNAKLALQSVVKKVKDLMWEDQSGIAENLGRVEEHLKLILNESEKLNRAENQ